MTMSRKYGPHYKNSENTKETLKSNNKEDSIQEPSTSMAPPRRYRVLDAPPEETIETEGDRQIRALLKRQLDTDISLDGQLSQKKKLFTSPVFLTPADDRVSGAKSLAEYKAKNESSSVVDELRQYGLTPEEIQFKLRAEASEGTPQTTTKSTGYSPSAAAQAAKLEAINKQIQTRKEAINAPDKFSGARAMSRHELELEMSITHNKEKSRLLGSLVTAGHKLDPRYDDVNHPINHLDDILQEVLDKKRDQQETEVVEEKPDCEVKPDTTESYRNTAWAPVYPFLEKPKPEPTATCARKPKQKSKKFIFSTDENVTEKPTCDKCDADLTKVVHAHVKSIPEEAIEKYRLSTSEIFQLDRFKHYHPGPPHKTLFLKNISTKVTETDLISLFMRYDDPNSPIEYRLLTGRMKGQAFITFPDVERATRALQLVNGYQFKGKPIVIQYGKK